MAKQVSLRLELDSTRDQALAPFSLPLALRSPLMVDGACKISSINQNFTIVLDTISEECRNGLPWELLFADDLAFIADSEEDLQRRWLKWQIGMESKGLKVNTGKTEVMVSGRNGTKVNIKYKEGRELNQVDQFKYLVDQKQQ